MRFQVIAKNNDKNVDQINQKKMLAIKDNKS